MERPQLKQQLTRSLIASVALISALWLINLSAGRMTGWIGNYTDSQAVPDAGANLIKFFLWLVLAFVLVRAVSALFFEGVYLLRGYQAPQLVRNIFFIIAFLLSFIGLFKWFYPNVALAPILATSTIFGLILGLALQDTLGNFFAGVSFQADKPFNVGDVVTVGNKSGVVEGVTWRGVKIRTFANHVVLVSNSSLAKESLEVCPRDNLNARLVFFNTLYSDSPAKTIHVVREAIREAENVSRKMRPIVRIRDFADSGIDYEVKYWLEDYAKFNDTDALLRQLIWYAFRRNGINFAFPTRTLHIERAARQDAAHQNKFFERLSAIDIFAPLTDEETNKLAAGAAGHVFAPNETVIRAGDEGASMFVVNRGRVKIQITDNGGSAARTVATLNEGDFFGEMALLTGEPRTANVVATEETEVIEIGHDALKNLFDDNPDLVEALSDVMAERRATLAAKAQTPVTKEEEKEGLLSSIRRFFKLD